MTGKMAKSKLCKLAGKQVMKLAVIIAALWIALSLGCAREEAKTAGTKAPSRKEISKDERMEWWRDARFGMFIHWVLMRWLPVMNGSKIKSG